MALLTQALSWKVGPVNAKPLILHDNLFLLGTPTATDTASGYSILNILDRRAYTLWKAASYGTKYVTIDCATAQSANAIAMAGHNLHTADAIIKVQSSSDNTNWTTRHVNFKVSSDKPFLRKFTSASARYWRISITTASIAPYAAVIFLGTTFEFEQYPESGFDPYNEKPAVTSAVSETGNLLGVITSYVAKAVSASFTKIPAPWVTVLFKPIWDSYLKYYYPFFWAWDLVNHPDEIDFVRIKVGQGLSTPYDPVRQSLTLQMEGIME